MSKFTVCYEEHPLGLVLLRDGECLFTPKRNELVVPNDTLAEAVATELSQQDNRRHLTKLTYTALDTVEDARDIIIESMIAYLHTDTICYMSEDPKLKQHERKYWQPIFDWAREKFCCEIDVFEGVMPQDQSGETCDIIAQY